MYARTLAISCVLALCSAAALPERERVNSVSDASGSVNTAAFKFPGYFQDLFKGASWHDRDGVTNV